MPNVQSNGVRIHYEVAGDGPPLLLLHGLGASGNLNWRLPGWVDELRSTHRLILVDHRGHGQSGKPHDAGGYSIPLMAGDALAVLGAAGIQRAAVMGYSMGSMVALELLLNSPDRFSAAVLGGMGSAWPRRGEVNRCPDEPESDPAPGRPHWRPGRRLRLVGSFMRHYDPIAQRTIRRAVFRGRPPVDASRLGEIKVPVLVVAGSRDFLCGASKDLAARIPNARHVTLSGRGHMGAVRDERFRACVKTFLADVDRG